MNKDSLKLLKLDIWLNPSVTYPPLKLFQDINYWKLYPDLMIVIFSTLITWSIK